MGNQKINNASLEDISMIIGSGCFRHEPVQDQWYGPVFPGLMSVACDRYDIDIVDGCDVAAIKATGEGGLVKEEIVEFRVSCDLLESMVAIEGYDGIAKLLIDMAFRLIRLDNRGILRLSPSAIMKIFMVDSCEPVNDERSMSIGVMMRYGRVLGTVSNGGGK